MGVPVPELAGHVHLQGELQKPLEGVFRHHPHVVRGAAGHNEHLADVLDLLLRQGDVVQHHLPLPDAGGDGLAQGFRLLADLLHHEVLVAAFFRSGDVPLDALRLLLDRIHVLVEELDALPGEHGDLLVLQPVDVPGAGEDGRHIGGDVVLPFSDADDERAVFPHGEELLRAVGADDAQSVAALHPGDHLPDGLQHVALVVVLQHLGHHFRVRLRDELHPPADEVVLQVQVVLDNAVVHHGELAPVADLGVGVDVRRRAVGGPPGVADAHHAGQGLAPFQNAVQDAQPPLGLHHVKPRVVVHSHPSGVIPPVFQLLQAREQNGGSFLPTDITNDAAHTNLSFLSGARPRKTEGPAAVCRQQRTRPLSGR